MKLAAKVIKQHKFDLKTRMGRFPKIKHWRLVRGDKVGVVGIPKLLGQTGTVIKVLRKQNRLIVDGVNLRKRFFKATPLQSGYAKLIPSPVHYSKLQLVDPITQKPTRAHFKFLESGEKVRVSVVSGAVIPKVDVGRQAVAAKKRLMNKLTDTPAEAVLAKTYAAPDLAAMRAKYSELYEAKLARKVREALEDAESEAKWQAVKSQLPPPSPRFDKAHLAKRKAGDPLPTPKEPVTAFIPVSHTAQPPPSSPSAPA